MATEDEVKHLRRITNYSATDPYDDVALGAMLDATSLNRTAQRLWSEEAARTAGLVNTSESGSSRSLGSLHAQALKMADYYKAQAETEEQPETPVDTTWRARTRAIERESAG